MSATAGSALSPTVANGESFAVWAPGKPDTITAVLARAVEQSPDRVFLDFSGETYSYAQVWDLSLRRAAGLAQLGLGHGETVVCMLDNNVDAIVTWFAANFLGAHLGSGQHGTEGRIPAPSDQRCRRHDCRR